MNKLTQLFIIMIVTLLAFGGIFRNQFVIDDQYFIQDWPLTRSWSNLPALLSGANPESQPGVYRPVRGLLYLLYYHLGDTNPLIYHLHSLATHLATTLLVYFVVKQILQKIQQKAGNLPFITALLFGLHPIHTESITYIAASMEMIGITFALASFLSYLSHKKISTLLFATLAFFTYEMTLTLPLLLALYELTLGKKNWSKIWPLFIPLVSYLFIRFGILHLGAGRGDYLAFSFYHTQLTMTKVWFKYLTLLIFPVSLSHNHTILPGFEAFMTPYSNGQAILNQSILDVPILLSLVCILALLYLALKSHAKYPWLSFAVGWFFISLLPVAYFLPQGTALAEKYLYLSSLSVIGFISLGISCLLTSNKKLGVAVLALLVFFYTTQTISRNKHWQTPQTLWEHEVVIHPESELAFYNLGNIYTQLGQRDKAISAYQNALKIQPRFWEARHNLQNLLAK